MTDVRPFGLVVLIVAAVLLVAVLSNRISERIRVPAPAIFLVGAAVASDVFPVLGSVPLGTDARIVTVALVVILFAGGMQIGWQSFRAAVSPILLLGVVGTVATAGALALAAHAFFGFAWLAALLLGTALAPTDPAVVFAVLGRREIEGRTGTILKGEAGANDPVGIAMMAALLATAGGGTRLVLGAAGTFAEQMLVGALVGAAGGYLLLQFMRRVPLPNEALYPARVIASAAVIYGAAAVLGGSGFLAVLLAGIIVGDARAPYKREIERFASGLGSIAEIVVFTVLGLTINLQDVVRSGELWVGIGLALILILLVRPVLIGALMSGVRMARGERLFVLWAGLKGAVPLILGLFALGAGAEQGPRVYGVIVVVVLVSVAVQGGLVPLAARLLHVPMRLVDLEPWALGMRFQAEPEGPEQHVVMAGSAADGAAIADLDLGEDAWVSMVSRRGHLVLVKGRTRLHAGDEVLVIGRPDDAVGQLFRPTPG